MTTAAIRTIRAVTACSSFIFGLDLNGWFSAIMVVKQVVLLCVSIYHMYISQFMDKLCRLPSYINRALTAKCTISMQFWRPFNKMSLWTSPPRVFGKHVDLPDSAHSTNIHINCGLSLVSTMDCSTLILLCLLLVIVSTFDTISTKVCLNCDEHWCDKQYISADSCTNYKQKLSHDGWSAGNRPSTRCKW